MSIQKLIASVVAVRSVEVEFEGTTETIRVRALGFREANAINLTLLGADGKVDTSKVQDYREKLLAQSIVDEDGKPVFTPEQVAEWPVLLADKIEKAIRAANGLTDEAGPEATKN